MEGENSFLRKHGADFFVVFSAFLKILLMLLFALCVLANVSDILDANFFDPENPIWTWEGGGWERSSKLTYTIVCSVCALYYAFAIVSPLFIKNKYAVWLVWAVGIFYIFYGAAACE